MLKEYLHTVAYKKKTCNGCKPKNKHKDIYTQCLILEYGEIKLYTPFPVNNDIFCQN